MDKKLKEIFIFKNIDLDTVKLPDPVRFEKHGIISSDTLGIVLKGIVEAVDCKGAVLNRFREGDPFGAALVFDGDDSGKKGVSEKTGDFEKNDVFEGTSISGSSRLPSTFRASTNCTIQFVPEDIMRNIFMDHPETAIEYIRFLNAKIKFLNRKLTMFAEDNVEGRLYRYLVENDGTGGMSMTKIASMLHIGRTSLYRALDELEKKELIERKEGVIKVL